MTDLRQAAQQALEALHYSKVEAITALREALAQPVQEPVAWADKRSLDQIANFDATIYAKGGFDNATPLYTAPPAAQLEPTPWRDMVVATLVREGIDKHRARELADHFAAQRPWQGLTDDDRFEIAAEQHGWEDLLIAAEAKLKERNG